MTTQENPGVINEETILDAKEFKWLDDAELIDNIAMEATDDITLSRWEGGDEGVARMKETSKIIGAVPMYDSRQINMALTYLEYRLLHPSDGNKHVAAHIGITRQYMMILVDQWKANGLLDYARKLILTERAENIQSALDQVVTGWPEVLLGILEIAKDKKQRAQDRITASKFLQEMVIDGYMTTVPKGPTEEDKYLQETDDTSFNPVDIPHLIVDEEGDALEDDDEPELDDDDAMDLGRMSEL